MVVSIDIDYHFLFDLDLTPSCILGVNLTKEVSKMVDLTITQVAAKYNINPDTVRYYERVGLIPKVPRKENGNRYYPDSLQHWLEMLVCLRHSGVSVEVLHDYTELILQGDATLETRKELLQEQVAVLKQRQADIQRSIERLEHKISLYESGEIKQDKSYFKEYHIAEQIAKERGESGESKA